MMRREAPLTVASVLLGVCGFAGTVTGPAEAQGPSVEGSGYVLGDTTAAVLIVEFGDFACSACAEFWRETWPRVRGELVETGRVAWRHVPFLLGFDRGDEGANAAECAADQGAFWAMHDRLFEGQAEWTRGRRPEELFFRYAEEIGLEPTAFRQCYDDEAGEDRTDAATRAARDAGVRGTPTFFINGRPAVGALPFEMFLELVERAEQEGRRP
jgi:protein-disulfide isomerase